MRKIYNRLETAGSLMIEAMAMLALIAMVTPILYKKAAERTTELKDINAASQMRVMSAAIDNYIKDHFSEIVSGAEVETDCQGAATQSYAAFQNDQGGAVKIDNIAHLCEYLPYGFVDDAGNVRGSNTFSGYQLSIGKRVAQNDPSNVSLTGFLLGDPKTPLSMLRASRIASMIGSNGGYTDGDVANGVQGVWKIDDLGTLDLEPSSDGSIITASLQSISRGLIMNEDVLYRTAVPGDNTGEYNRMKTDFHLGGNDIDEVNKMIIDNADGDDDALTIENGGLTISNGGADIAGHLEADSAGITGNLAAGSADVSGALSAGGNKFQVNASGDLAIGGDKFKVQASTGKTDIAGDTTIGGDKFKVEASTGNTTIQGDVIINKGLEAADGKFDVDGTTGDTTIGGNTIIRGTLEVDKSATFHDDVTIDKGLSVAGDKFYVDGDTGDTYIDANLEVTGALKTDKLLSKTLKGGLMGTDFSATPENDNYVFTAQWNEGDINKSKVFMGPNDEVIVGNKTVQMNYSGTKVEIAPTDGTITLAPGGTGSRELYITKGKTLVDNGSFVVSTGTNTDLNQFQTADNQVDFFTKPSTSESIFTVTNTSNQTKGSVQVRQGVVEIASNYDSTISPLPTGGGYILADRFIDQKNWDGALAIPKVSGISYPTPDYDAYQVNPAYTSVMHDIKLTTRGGSRLSDILPDFVNKGIYVVDNSYDENVPYWGNLTVSVSGGKLKANIGSGKICANHSCWTSPWLGLIPAPLCPPGYARVVTITPAGWAMGQAGVPGSRVGTNRQDLWTPNYPKNPNDYNDSDPDAPSALYFQKSTWLRANMYPHSSGSSFMGWSAIMGFMYPYAYYTDYIKDLGLVSDLTGGTADNEKVIWNLFPVLKRQLEAYVTVYCYFDRNSSIYNENYVDKYDQLNDYRTSYTKESGYTTRLNDPKLNYKDIW